MLLFGSFALSLCFKEIICDSGDFTIINANICRRLHKKPSFHTNNAETCLQQNNFQTDKIRTVHRGPPILD